MFKTQKLSGNSVASQVNITDRNYTFDNFLQSLGQPQKANWKQINVTITYNTKKSGDHLKKNLLLQICVKSLLKTSELN